MDRINTLAQFREQKQDIVGEPADKWAAYFNNGFGIERLGMFSRNAIEANAAQPQAYSPEDNNLTEEEKEEKKEQEARAYVQMAQNLRYLTQQYALDYIDKRIGDKEKDLANWRTEADDFKRRLAEISGKKAILEDKVQLLSSEIAETKAQESEVAKASAETQVALESAQKAVDANAEAREKGIRDSQGRLIVRQDIVDEITKKSTTMYFVMEEGIDPETGEKQETMILVGGRKLPREQQEDIFDRIHAAERDSNQIIAHGNQVLSPEDQKSFENQLSQLVERYYEGNARRNFLQDKIRDQEAELKGLKKEIEDLDKNAAKYQAEYDQRIERIQKGTEELEEMKKLRSDMASGKYKTPEERNAAMTQTFGKDWENYYGNKQKNDITQFLDNRNWAIKQQIARDLRPEIRSMHKEGVSESDPEMLKVREKIASLENQAEENLTLKDDIISGQYSNEELNAVMQEKFGNEWSSWVADRSGNAIASAAPATPANVSTASAAPSFAPQQSTASAVFGDPSGIGETSSAFNAASNNAPVRETAPDAAPAAPTIAAVRKNMTAGMAVPA